MGAVNFAVWASVLRVRYIWAADVVVPWASDRFQMLPKHESNGMRFIPTSSIALLESGEGN